MPRWHSFAPQLITKDEQKGTLCWYNCTPYFNQVAQLYFSTVHGYTKNEDSRKEF